MKKLINGFNVEVTKATIYSEYVKSKLFFNTVSESWEIVSIIEKLGITYTVNGVIVNDDYYKPVGHIHFLDHAFVSYVKEAKAKGLNINRTDFIDIANSIVSDFFNEADNMIPTDLQYYNGEDELESLDKSVDHDIKLILSDIYYFKGFAFGFTPCKMPEANDKLLSKIVINNEAVDFAVSFEVNNGDLIEDEGSKFYPYLEALLADSDVKDDIREYIESVAFQHCLTAWNYEGFTDAAHLANEVKDRKRLNPVMWQGIINDMIRRNLTGEETASFYNVAVNHVYQWRAKLKNQA